VWIQCIATHGATAKRLKGMRLLRESKKATEGYVITQRWDDFKVLDVTSAKRGDDAKESIRRVAAIPAPPACYSMSPPPNRTGHIRRTEETLALSQSIAPRGYLWG